VSLKLYSVTVDLLHDGDYASFRERLRTMDGRQVLNHQWAIRSTYSAGELKELFHQFLDERGQITVTEVGTEVASRRALANLGEI
jgi:hypothetical protein